MQKLDFFTNIGFWASKVTVSRFPGFRSQGFLVSVLQKSSSLGFWASETTVSWFPGFQSLGFQVSRFLCFRNQVFRGFWVPEVAVSRFPGVRTQGF